LVKGNLVLFTGVEDRDQRLEEHCGVVR